MEKCNACGLKKGHRPGCVNAEPCKECGMTLGHDFDCGQAPDAAQERIVANDEAGRRRTTVDGAEAEIVISGTTGEPIPLLEVPQEELIHSIATKREEIVAQKRVAKREKDKLSNLELQLDAMVDALCERDRRERENQLGIPFDEPAADAAELEAAQV